MEINKETLYSGLNLMYIGELTAIIGLIVGLAVIFLPGGGALALSLLILLIALAGAIVSVAGLFKLRGEHADYKNALILLIISIIYNFIGGRATGFLPAVLDLAGTVLGLVRVYLVVRATNTFLSAVGREELTAEGNRAFYAQIVGAVVALVSSALTVMLSENLGGLVVLLVLLALVGIVVEALYLIYLKHSAAALR